MAQMPNPIATAPPASQIVWVLPRAAVTRPARSSAAYEAQIAITTERITNRSSYDPARTGPMGDIIGIDNSSGHSRCLPSLVVAQSYFLKKSLVEVGGRSDPAFRRVCQ